VIQAVSDGVGHLEVEVMGPDPDVRKAGKRERTKALRVPSWIEGRV